MKALEFLQKLDLDKINHLRTFSRNGGSLNMYIVPKDERYSKDFICITLNGSRLDITWRGVELIDYDLPRKEKDEVLDIFDNLKKIHKEAEEKVLMSFLIKE